MNNYKRTLDLFCGCGGMSLGFINAGYDLVGAIDNWEPAIEVYNANFSHEVFNMDISNIEKVVKLIRSYNIETIVAGPPCQDFSHAGKREEGHRANLTIIFANIIKKIKPTWFIMENVDRILRSKSYNEARELGFSWR